MRTPVKAVIACAMDEEISPFLQGCTDTAQVLEPRGPGDFQRFYTATLAHHEVVLVRTGIGLVNAAAAAERTLLHFDPELYLLAGTTGGLAPQVEVGDVIAGTSALFFDADATAFGYAPGQIPQMPADYRSTVRTELLPANARAGMVLSGNSFVTAASAAERREQFPGALAVDMETAAAASVCLLYGVSWLSLRAVSDLCGPRADQEFHMGSDRAAGLSFDAVEALLRRC